MTSPMPRVSVLPRVRDGRLPVHADSSGHPGGTGVADTAPGPVAESTPGRVARRVLLSAAVLAVVVVHFRPWQGGLLEDWGLARAWQEEGISGFVTRVPATIGRPLHLLPHYVGMALSDGGFAGPYGVLALVAVGQLLVGMWALRPLTSNWPVRWALALVLALHPWWAAGDVLRFMPAQVSVLAVVTWLGAAVRFLHGGSRRWLALVVAAPVVGLLTYQAPAFTLLGAAVVCAVSMGRLRRGLVLTCTTTAAVGAALGWSVVIAPLIEPGSYESQLLDGDSGGLLHQVHVALATLLLHGPQVLVAAAVVGVVVIALGLAGELAHWQVWALLAAVAGAPLASLVYGSNPLQLNDPERLVMPVGLLAWIVLASVADRVAALDRLRAGVLTVALATGVVGAAAGFAQWAGYSSEQHQLLDAASAAVAELPAGSHLVVADTGGRYGDVYLLMPPHLGIALQVEHGTGADTVLCTPAGVVRDQPVAALYPVATTPDCAEFLAVPGVASLGHATTDLGVLDLYAVPDAD